MRYKHVNHSHDVKACSTPGAGPGKTAVHSCGAWMAASHNREEWRPAPALGHQEGSCLRVQDPMTEQQRSGTTLLCDGPDCRPEGCSRPLIVRRDRCCATDTQMECAESECLGQMQCSPRVPLQAVALEGCLQLLIHFFLVPLRQDDDRPAPFQCLSQPLAEHALSAGRCDPDAQHLARGMSLLPANNMVLQHPSHWVAVVIICL